MSDLIYNQWTIPPEKWRYGLRTSAATGCGWIATYNALTLMGYKADPEKLIRYYEHQVPVVHGSIGTLLFAPALYFRKRGFHVETTANRARFDGLAARADVCILFYRWHQGTRLGAHFIALQHTDAGFLGYNVHKSSTGPEAFGPSLDHYLTEKKRFGAVLIAIWNKE